MKIRKIAALLTAAVFALSLAAFSIAESDYEELSEELRQQNSWEQMLGIALREAYRLQAGYGALTAAFPDEGAFREGLDAATAHLQYMLALCAAHEVGPEAGEPPVLPEPPESLQEAYQHMFQAEERYAFMTQEFLNNEKPPEEAGGLLLHLKERAQERIQACEENAEKLGYAYEFRFTGENGEGDESNDDPGQEDGQNREGVDNNDDANGEGVDNNDDPGQEDGQNREGIDNNDDENGEGVDNNDDPGQEEPGEGENQEGVDNNDDENGEGVDNNDDPGQEDGQSQEGPGDESGDGANGRETGTRR